MITWDRLNKGASCIISADGLNTSSLNHINSVRATEGVSDGKWYWEIRVNTAGAPLIGVIGSNAFLLSSSLSNSDVRYYFTNGQKWNPRSEYGAPYTTGDLISVLLDLDLGTIEFMKNGVSQGVAFTDLKSMGEVFPAISDGGSAIGGSYTANFGDSNFVYKMPDGYSQYGKTKRMTIKNPTTDELHSLSDNTLIHLPDNTTESIIEHGVEQGKFIQLDVPFDKHRYFNDTPVNGTSGKVFTHDVRIINTLSIKEFAKNEIFEPIFTWYETKMNSDALPSPLKATASSYYVSNVPYTYFPFRAFDGNISDISTSNTSCWATDRDAFVDSWLMLDFGELRKVNTVQLIPRNETWITQAAKEFKIESSIDGAVWNVVGNFDITDWQPLTSKKLDLSLSEGRYFRITHKSNNGGQYISWTEVKYGYKREVN
ncbi:SPRY domain-containing protein [Lysinibacillus fusiformis]|uniref:SPRY domain-containing protein n=1 Tax=Lysinibacillus fusiformis TaxID=28031 RepID=UPI0011A8E9C4|nr:SPRY domain-containing protein [Lysinibacillus fusiformis]